MHMSDEARWVLEYAARSRDESLSELERAAMDEIAAFWASEVIGQIGFY
jgi:hypothetical protein